VENLIGGSSPDTLIGSALANRITGGLGVDRLRGLGGDDTLVARDGVVDTEIQCDGGAPAGTADQATLDTADPTPSNCETVTRKRGRTGRASGATIAAGCLHRGQPAFLEEAGYVAIERPVSDRRRRVRARLTPTGREAFEGHVAALRAIVGPAAAESAPARLRGGAAARRRRTATGRT
jgi:Ca2+-binding RTX toxin-like protein